MSTDYTFEKTHELDSDKFAALIIAAKGPNRTMKDFAEACGLAASTFTRITQKINKGASSPELIKAVAQNADPNSGITLDDLASASGYTISKISHHFNDRNSRITHRHIIRNFILDNWLSRGESVKFEQEIYQIGKSYSFTPDALITTTALGQDCKWLIMCILSDFHNSRHPDYNVYSGLQKAKTFFGDFLLIHTSISNISKPSRYTIVVNNTDVFMKIQEEFSHLIFPMHVSILLVDALNSTILNEFRFPCQI